MAHVGGRVPDDTEVIDANGRLAPPVETCASATGRARRGGRPTLRAAATAYVTVVDDLAPLAHVMVESA